MGLDFSRLTSGSPADRATEPRRIFSALPAKQAQYGYPRDVQSEVWERWHNRRRETDLVIKMNTGGGKTVIGLVLLKSCLNENVGPAAYITPDKYLTHQVREEANALGIETTDDPRSQRFLAGKAILVTNIYRLVNGLSVFGVAGAARRIEIGALLIDDVHACVATLEEQFTLKIPGSHDAFTKLLELFEEDMEHQSGSTLLDIRDNTPSAVLRVPFWAWADRQAQVHGILHPHREEDGFKFVWPLIAEALPVSTAVVSARQIEIAPPCPPVGRVPSIAAAQRRIYLTATLADDSVLVTHFGGDPEPVRRPITPKTADDLGDRMILMPQETHPRTTDLEIREFLTEQATRHNVVVIVPSHRRAQEWEPHADAVHDKDTIHAGVEALRAGHVGLVVLVNKYDGIDLPGNACRILAIDGLPEAYGGLARLEALALDTSDAMVTRQIQRIEQGMGRGVRSNDDHCVVLLLGSRLTQRLYSASGLARFSPATRAQLKLSHEVADMLHGRPFTELALIIDQCLNRDSGWVSASKNALDGLTYDTSATVSETAIAERKAFDLAVLGQHHQAADILQTAIDGLCEPRLRGWLKQQAAAYRHHHDPVRAQQMLLSALIDNPALTKPRDGISYDRLLSHGDQAKRCAEHIAATYNTAGEMLVGIAAILDDLVPDPNRTDKFEQAWSELGLFLGFAAQRPERDTGQGPDVLWSVGELTYHVTECKSGVVTDFIAKKDAAQLSHAIDWFGSRYDHTCRASPVMIHKSAVLHSTATARPATRIITFAKLAALREAVRGFAKSIAQKNDQIDNMIGPRLVAAQLTAGEFLNAWAVPARKK